MALFARSYQELVSQCIEDLATNTNLTRLSAGGKARAITESVSRRLEEAYDRFDLNFARAFLSSASGQYLDLIGAILGVEREKAQAASADTDVGVIKFYVESGTFGDINSGNDITVTKDIVVSSEEDGAGTSYKLTSGVTLTASSSEKYLSARAMLPGSSGNIGTGTLTYHNFTGYTDSENKTLLVTNSYPIANGKDAESDANYRYRIANKVLSAEAANETAIRLAALSVPGVADIVMKRRYRGIGTVAVIIQSVTPTVSSALIAAVAAKVEVIMAAGDIAFVMGPKETGLEMNITVHYAKQLTDDELDSLEEELENTITEYVNSLDIGETFSINKLVASLFSIDENIANLGETGKPIDALYIYKASRLGDNKIRQTLLGDYTPQDDERVIIEPSVSSPITFTRKYIRR